MSTDGMMVVITGISVFISMLMCIASYKSVKVASAQVAEMQKQYSEKNRPYITVEFIYERRAFYGLRIANQGQRLANHVKLKFSDDFLKSVPDSKYQTLLEKQKDKTFILGIGAHYDIYVGGNKLRDIKNKKTIEGSIEYYDENVRYEDFFSVDVENYATFYSVDSDIDDLKKKINEQNSILKDIATELRTVPKETEGND